MIPFSRGLAVISALLGTVSAAPVINEICYRPGQSYPENTALEFVEIHNPDAEAVDLTGWAFSDGIQFTFPPGTVLEAGGYLVVAADPAALAAASGVSGIAGPWQAGDRLANSGETVTLTGAFGEEVDSVTYADEGDWAFRVRETLAGWRWITQSNGGGASLERRNPRLAADNGQNWGDSGAVGGSPGAANFLLADDIAPVVRHVRHAPAVPRSGEVVTVSCELVDELGPASLAATLHWRVANSTTPGPFQQVAMVNEGNGRFSTTLAAMADQTLVEFYIAAGDGTQTRTWPAPTAEGQTANCNFQVDDEAGSPGVPTYRLILTGTENEGYEEVAELYTPFANLENIEEGDRRFNLTLIASEGGETVIRYRADMRIRGASSRRFVHKALRVSLPADDPWDGVTDFNLNPKYPWLQLTGMRLFQAAGLAGANAMPVEVRRNGEESTTGDGNDPDFGRWVRVEALDGEFVDRNWPGADVQLYRKGNEETQWDSGFPLPATPDGSYSGWLKQNRGEANDWSDIVGFIELWQTLAAPRFSGESAGDVASGNWNDTPFSEADLEALAEVADLDQMARWFAVMTLLGSGETSISNGVDDDYAAAWVSDGGARRMQLIPHDLDTVLGQGDDPYTATDGGLYDMTDDGDVFEPLLPLFGDENDPGNAIFLEKYHTAIRELLGGIFDADTATNPYPPFHAFVDHVLGDWVPAEVRQEMKAFMTARQAYLLGQIGAPKIVPPVPAGSGTFYSPPAAALRINEVLAVNTTTLAVGGDYPDLIELHNAGSTAIALAGHVIADSESQYVFPSGSGSIAAGGFRLIHSNVLGFGLAASGDRVQLRSPGGAVLDDVVFGPQLADRSIARIAGNPATWALSMPSPATANGAALPTGSPAVLVINEWAGNVDYRLADDFIELHNPDPLPVALGGLRVTDRIASDPARYQFPPLGFIATGGFFEVDSDTLGFGLDGSFESIWLSAENGAVIHQVAMIGQAADVSTGLAPDGGTAWTTYPLPTPGLPNATPAPGADALFEHLRITEIMFQPSGGGDYEFVELHNTGSTALALGGVRFTAGISYEFAPGTPLAAGGYVVICKNRTAFLSRYPGLGPLLADGVFSGALANEGERLALTLPAPSPLHVLSFSYAPDWYPAAGKSLHVRDPLVTPPAAWEDSRTWIASAALHGSPGSGEVPVITSTVEAVGTVGAPFAFMISATGAPTSFSASGLPAGLTVDPASGLISGSPLVDGFFAVELAATGSAGTAAATLDLTIQPYGPLDHFLWEEVPTTARAGRSFAVRISARDAGGRLVGDHEGTATLSAFVTAPGSSPVLITEVTDGDEDQFELQNLTAATVETAGWFVVVGESNDIQNRNDTTYFLPPLMAPGAVLRVSDSSAPGRLYFGDDIGWADSNPRGWIMLFDATATLRDFVAFGQWTAPALAGLSIEVGGNLIRPVASGHWSGAAIPGDPGEDDANFWQRAGGSDSDSAAGWTWSLVASSLGSPNPGLVLPWVVDLPLAITPPTVAFTGGQFYGVVKVADFGNPATLRAVGSLRRGDSPPLEILPFTDADLDGMPDDWEGEQGLSSADPADALLDADGDGRSNLAEFQAGTDPHSAASVLRITSFVGQPGPGGTFTLEWSAVAGKLYHVTASADLGLWSHRASRLSNAAGTLSVEVPVGTGPQEFFRVEVEP